MKIMQWLFILPIAMATALLPASVSLAQVDIAGQQVHPKPVTSYYEGKRQRDESRLREQERLLLEARTRQIEAETQRLRDAQKEQSEALEIDGESIADHPCDRPLPLGAKLKSHDHPICRLLLEAEIDKLRKENAALAEAVEHGHRPPN